MAPQFILSISARVNIISFTLPSVTSASFACMLGGKNRAMYGCFESSKIEKNGFATVNVSVGESAASGAVRSGPRATCPAGFAGSETSAVMTILGPACAGRGTGSRTVTLAASAAFASAAICFCSARISAALAFVAEMLASLIAFTAASAAACAAAALCCCRARSDASLALEVCAFTTAELLASCSCAACNLAAASLTAFAAASALDCAFAAIVFAACASF